MRASVVVRRRLCVIGTLGLAAVTLGISPVMAAASERSAGTMRPPPTSLGASQMTLAQAPIGLQVAARSALASLSGSQQAKLTASDGAAGDHFGVSVAISGSTAVVGALDHGNLQLGAVYVFVRSGTVWTEQATLTASDGTLDDGLGSSVAISGSTVLVGAPTKNSRTGAAYVFVGSGTVWSQQAELTASDGAPGDDFGYSVATSGSTAVVGARGSNTYTGAAYVFKRSGTAWSQQAELTAADAAAQDQFGYSVAISGSIAVVGAWGKNTAYVFVRSGTAWSQQATLTAADGSPGDAFGVSVAISGSTAVVGAERKNSVTGAAYVFVGSGTSWTQQAMLIAGDGSVNDTFGSSVAISASIAVVGAQGRNSRTGAAYVFKRSGTAWSEQTELTACDGAAGDIFGVSAGISGSTPVVGAAGNNSAVGAAYVYVLGAIEWSCKAAVPTARAGLAAAVAKGKIYAIGGYNGAELNSVEVYDPAADSWASVASMPTARGGLAAASAMGKVYAIGGCSGGSSKPAFCDYTNTGTSLNAVEGYSPATNKWTTKAPLPTARADLAAVTGKDGKIYAIGGWNVRNGFNDPVALNTVEAYDPVTNAWTTRAPMPTARYWVSAALGSDGKIYAIGGVNTDTTITPALEAYDPSTDTWATLAPVPLAFGGPAASGAAFLGGKIYAIGGTDGDATPLATLEAYNLKTGTWTSQTAMPTGRGYLAAVATGGIVYAIGGYNNRSPYTGDLSQVEAF